MYQLNIIGFKNLNWWEADELVIYKHDQGVEQGSTNIELRLPLSGQSANRIREHWISSLASKPLVLAASSQIDVITITIFFRHEQINKCFS